MYSDDSLVNALAKGHLPDLFIDPIRHDVLHEPVILEDGSICSKESITHWFGVCESQKLSLTSPLTGHKISSTLTENKPLKEMLDRYSRLLMRLRRVVMTGCSVRRLNEIDKELILNFSPINVQLELLLSIHRLTRLFIPIQNIPIAIRDLIPRWEAPQVAVLGEISCGKSTILERISLMSLFTTSGHSNSGEGRGEKGSGSGKDEGEDHLTHTCLPIHLKLRQSAHYSPPVLRVLDTKRKVQLGQAIVLSSLEKAASQIAQLSREIYLKTSQKRQPDDQDTSLSSTSSSLSSQPKEAIYCLDRALIIHFHSPYVPSIDLIDLPGLLPLARPQSSLFSSPSNQAIMSSDYDAEWAKWRTDREELIHQFVLQNPRSIFLAVVEANMNEVATSRTLSFVQSLGIQVTLSPAFLSVVLLSRETIGSDSWSLLEV
jgi:hypothetical protein